MASNETFVCSDRAFDVAFFFGSLSDLKQLRSVPTYFFFAGRYVPRFFTRFEDYRGLARFGQKEYYNGDNEKGANNELHSGGAA